jgi:hypothetical protein
MPHGGKRRGAGRKPSSLTVKSRAIAEIAIEEGIKPLEVMLRAMRGYANSQQWDRAAAIAKDAGPYLHPKLTSVEPPEREPPNNAQEPPKNAPDFSSLTDEELEILTRLSRKIRYPDTPVGG